MSNSQYGSDAVEQSIPVRVMIGAIGHREVLAEPMLIERIHFAIESVRQMVPPLPNTPLVLTVLSPLAEGADRLIAQEILKIPGSMLEVVLPLEKDDYVKDFETSQSRVEFEELLSRSRHVKQLNCKGSRNEAYEQAGFYVVDHCDVLIALWDGKQAAGQGGTGDVVQYARENNCPLVWIHTDDKGEVTVELGDGIGTESLDALTRYNSERVDAVELEERTGEQCDSLTEQAERAHLPSERLQSTFEYILRHYFRADLLSLRYQRLYHRTGNLVYALAAAAIALVALQILFLPDQPRVLILEVAFMAAALVIVWQGRRRRWHTKWIDYRFFAERFRSALFMAVANIDIAASQPLRHLSSSQSFNNWMVAAFSSVWAQRPRIQDSDSWSTEGLKDFLCEAWIDDQIHYHDSTSERHYGRHQRMSRVSSILFGLTLLAALIHVIDISPQPLDAVLVFTVIASPAAAGSITAIRTHREYLRNSLRSAEMVGHLKELRGRMTETRDREPLLRLVAEAEQTMVHENEDWHVVVRFHIPELPV